MDKKAGDWEQRGYFSEEERRDREAIRNHLTLPQDKGGFGIVDQTAIEQFTDRLYVTPTEEFSKVVFVKGPAVREVSRVTIHGTPVYHTIYPKSKTVSYETEKTVTIRGKQARMFFGQVSYQRREYSVHYVTRSGREVSYTVPAKEYKGRGIITWRRLEK